MGTRTHVLVQYVTRRNLKTERMNLKLRESWDPTMNTGLCRTLRTNPGFVSVLMYKKGTIPDFLCVRCS